MNTRICTLFEGHYHHGLAGLINSLYQQGYRGEVYAGYRGELPGWAAAATLNSSLEWEQSRTLEVAAGLYLHLLPIDTTYHLTNYKPTFMLRLLAGPAQEAAGIAYFDPDIVIKCQWEFYERWIANGVALVHEITANNMPPTHPLRLQWGKVIEMCDRQVTRQIGSYINGGFCGVSRNHIEFLQLWAQIMETAIAHFGLVPDKFMPSDRTHIFFASDQDALNITAMCSQSPISVIGPEGMDFIHGGWTMSHAIGSPKPWKKSFLWFACKGIPPSLADKAYWLNVEAPIANYSSLYVQKKRLSLLIAAFIGRFYRRNG